MPMVEVDLVNVAVVVVVVVVSVMVSLLVGPRAHLSLGDPPRVPRGGGWPSHPIYPLGEPVFDKLHADLGKAMLSINAVKGFETGSGFAAAAMRGSQHNDAFEQREGKTHTTTNHSGGIQGGISNGMPITFRVAFKPVASIKPHKAL